MGSSILFIPRVIVQEINIVGVYGLLKNARTVKVNGNYMYVADAGYGAKIFDISDTANPVFKKTINGNTNDIFITGDMLFICGTSIFKIYIISDPLLPVLIGSCALASIAPQDIFVTGNYAYVADWTSGCQIIDISIPSTPTIIYTYNSGSTYCLCCYVAGNYLYVGESASIKILNITIPSSPALVGSISFIGSCYGIKIVGNILYSTHFTTTNSFKIFNISNPTSPVLINQYSFANSNPRDVDVYENYAYVITYNASGSVNTGVYILNISNPANISFVKFKFFEKWGTSIYYDQSRDLIFLIVNPNAYILNPNF